MTKAEADRKRETMRIAAIEREYSAKLDDLRHNYALARHGRMGAGAGVVRPGAALRGADPPAQGRTCHPASTGTRGSAWSSRRLATGAWGWSASRLVCDEHLHLTEPAGQAPCPSLRQAVVPRLPPHGLSALRASDHVT